MPPFNAQLNPTGAGTADLKYPARFSTVSTAVALYTSVSPDDIKPYGMHIGDEIRIYDDATGEAIGGLRPSHGKLVWHPFQGKYAVENLT